MSVKITKLNRVIRNVEEKLFRNGDATICKTTAYVYLPYYLINETNGERLIEILNDVNSEGSYYLLGSDSVSDKMFKVFVVSQTSYVVKHEDDVDDQHLANILAKQKAMKNIEVRVLKALSFLYDYIGQERDEIDGLIKAYHERHIKTLNSHAKHLEMVQSK